MLGLEDRARRDAARLPAGTIGVGEPGWREIEAPVQQGIAQPAGIAQVDAGLAVVALARRPTPLPRHPNRVPALFGHITPVQDQDAVGLPQRLAHQALMGGEHGPSSHLPSLITYCAAR